jgi:hypothetical protein
VPMLIHNNTNLDALCSMIVDASRSNRARHRIVRKFEIAKISEVA